jgi:hypothetical protein
MAETQIPVADYTDHNEVLQSMQHSTVDVDEDRSMSTGNAGVTYNSYFQRTASFLQLKIGMKKCKLVYSANLDFSGTRIMMNNSYCFLTAN